MAGMINQLVDVMNDQAERYNELLGLSLEEKDLLVKNDIEGIQKITNLKNLVITQNNRLERKRISLVKDIAEVLGHSSQEELSLAELIELVGEQPEAEQLTEIGKRLREILEKLQESNNLNKQLLESSLDYVNYTLNMIQSSISPDLANYPDAGTQGQDVYGSFDTIR